MLQHKTIDAHITSHDYEDKRKRSDLLEGKGDANSEYCPHRIADKRTKLFDSFTQAIENSGANNPDLSYSTETSNVPIRFVTRMLAGMKRRGTGFHS